MTPVFLILVFLLAALQILLPRHIAFFPLLFAACNLSNTEIFADITGCRLLLILGLLRAVASSYHRTVCFHPLDSAFIIFAGISIAVSIVPRLDVPSPFKQNLGLILNTCGTYLYSRLYFTPDPRALHLFASALLFSLLPLACFLVFERFSSTNVYSYLGTVGAGVVERQGKLRAMGPFRHPILAGTAGATSLPVMLILYTRSRFLGFLGILASIAIVLSSNSSGPLAALMMSLLAISLWPFRKSLRAIEYTTLFTILILHLSSTRGIWYLMAYMDLVGGSTGYHRAKLIDSAMTDFGRWWMFGTDYTRDWMFSGVSWTDRHTDITNYYLHLGVIGGVGLLLTLIAIICIAYRSLQSSVRTLCETAERTGVSSYTATAFGVWCIAAALLSHAVSFVSISYFDQMYVLFYFLVGIVPALGASNQFELVNE